MPKGRGANERRRTYRQRHPRDNRNALEGGALKLAKLYEDWYARARKRTQRKKGR